jgi:hypothetical protein
VHKLNAIKKLTIEWGKVLGGNEQQQLENRMFIAA